jgi:hypothetical protein
MQPWQEQCLLILLYRKAFRCTPSTMRIRSGFYTVPRRVKCEVAEKEFDLGVDLIDRLSTCKQIVLTSYATD